MTQFSTVRILLYISFGAIFSSCDRTTIYQQEEQITGDIWKYSDSLSFSFEIPDTAQLYSMQLDVRHNDDFPYENCYVRIRSIYPDRTVKNDVLSLEFADQSGAWMGEKSGKYLLAPIALQPVARFRQAGRYTMVFFQDTRRDSLPGLHSMELRIDKKKPD